MAARASLLAALALILGAAAAEAQRLSALAPPPDWAELEAYQETITRAEFVLLLDTIYAPNQAAAGLIEVGEKSAVIHKKLIPRDVLELRFATDADRAKPAPRYWRSRATIATGAQPLAGVKIAIDPGHLGGAWAKLEERWFQIGESTPVTEGDLTLRVARRLAPQLTALGARVSLVRDAPEPVTPLRPDILLEAARAELVLEGIHTPQETYAGSGDPSRGDSVQFRSELLFFRHAEIRRRAELVNTDLQPDLVLCLHFDADAWGSPNAPQMTPHNRLHTLVNGAYSAGELRRDDVRHDMLMKLLQRCAPEELAANTTLSHTLARRLALPPYVYTRDTARRPGASPYVWARNLLANRLYRCPVVFLEPYAMNSWEVWARVQAGDYEGEQEVAGSLRPSIYREYADAVAAGVLEHFGERSHAEN